MISCQEKEKFLKELKLIKRNAFIEKLFEKNNLLKPLWPLESGDSITDMSEILPFLRDERPSNKMKFISSIRKIYLLPTEDIRNKKDKYWKCPLDIEYDSSVHPLKCPVCGLATPASFGICPYCGEKY